MSGPHDTLCSGSSMSGTFRDERYVRDGFCVTHVDNYTSCANGNEGVSSPLRAVDVGERSAQDTWCDRATRL